MINSNQRPLVLVVEDVDWIRAAMVGRLDACGYDVAEAPDASTALALAEHNPPTLVLTEEELPTYDELTLRLGQHPTLSGVPVVIINPDAGEGERHGDSILLSRYSLIGQLLTELKR